MSDGSLDSNELPPMPPLMKSKWKKLKQTSIKHGPSCVPPSPASNLLDGNMEKASCMRSALLENREDTSTIPPEYTSTLIPVSPPPLIKWTRNTIHSGSISNRQPAFKQTFRSADESENDESTTSMPPELEDFENRTSVFSVYSEPAPIVKPPPQIEKDSLTPAIASNTGVSVGSLRETSEQPDALDMPVGSRRPIRQNSDPPNVMDQKQDQSKRSKCKTLHRCQFCQKEFKHVSRRREHERSHTGDRPFTCDVCGRTFTHSGSLHRHKRTHTGERPHKCKKCGKSFTNSSDLRRHERIHNRSRPALIKSKRNMVDPSSREYDPSSVSPSPASNCVEENIEKASCMRSAPLENKEDTSSIRPEYTSSTIPISPPPLTKWTRNTIPSASISNRQPAFEQTFRTGHKSERDTATSSTPPEMEAVEKRSKRTSAFSDYDKRVSLVKPSPKWGMDVLTPVKASHTGVYAGKTRETWEQPEALAMPVERRRPIEQNPLSSKVMAQSQDPQKRSKCKISQRCQFCRKEFNYVSRLRQHEQHERVHTGDRPFKCDVCGMSFSHLHRNDNFQKFEIFFTTDSLQSQSPMIDAETLK
ncbi:zinc finger protein 319-like [Sycon ciliatum]|uniref:zinc finger protein 319-like n=1 Tax=Sycon ciliatum TaxID=27933 RepID=UPI0031F65909